MGRMNTTEKTPYFTKRRIALTHFLAGRGYTTALKAMAFAERFHQGVRKDKVTPEFQHLLEVALHVVTLRDLKDEEGTIAAALLHDVQEDYGVPEEELTGLFGKEIALSVGRLNKFANGVEKSKEAYFLAIANDHRASIAKGCDRVHNFQSMPKVFSLEKQKSYLQEGVERFMPMLKLAAQQFPEQFLAYQNIRHHMKSQISLIQHSHDASMSGKV
jgi:(p)ppGpp synthase/HD superfamily hydrolase